jgi:hypothetical protein
MKIDGLPAIGLATIVGAVLGYYVAAHFWKTGQAH